MNNLQKQYKEKIIPAMQEKFGIDNVMAVPKILKVSVNIGVNSRQGGGERIDLLTSTLERITGQKPLQTKAKKAISAFKVREGMVVGLKTTLRGKRMYDFIEKLINISLPRVRDFRGLLEKSVDNRGNLTIGFKEHNVFPEIKSDEVEQIHGLEVTINTSAENKEQGLELLRLYGFPFQNSADSK